MEWNPVLNFVKQLKKEYEKVFGTIDYDYKTGYTDQAESCIERWVLELNDNETNQIYTEWLDVIEPLEINQFRDLCLFRYGRYSNIYDGEEDASGEGFWDKYNGFYRECRSVVINVRDEEIVLACQKKFFNINELPESSLEVVQKKIANAKTAEFSDKLDGSMQAARWYKDKIIMCGSQALDPENSWRLADGYKMIHEKPGFEMMLRNNPEYTFTFEYISLRDAHVVKYTKEQEGLYLIGIRNNETGKEYDYKTIIDVANTYDIPTTKVFDKTLDQVMSELDSKSSDEAEGFVINVDNCRYKVKYDAYITIHRALSKLSSINLIIRMIADDKFDDLLSKLPLAYHDSVHKVANVVFDYIKRTEAEINDWYNKAPKEDRKEFMIWCENNVPKEFRGYVRQKYLGYDYNVIKGGNKNAPHYKKLNEMGVSNYKEVFEE